MFHTLTNLSATIKYSLKPTDSGLLPSLNRADGQKAVLIPTYGPSEETLDLIVSLMKLHADVEIVVIDDSTPATHAGYPIIESIKQVADYYPNLTYLRTETNTLKAGALNLGLVYLLGKEHRPHTIFTFDDDVQILPTTLSGMVEELYANNQTGAVCSQALVKNKNKNIITRLQSLEYHNFNITKIADNGFIMGPLVMQGMLTAFKTEALLQVDGFSERHLIEDYDITTRLKKSGWTVGIAKQSQALTSVPESFEALWKQRARWSYGGLRVTRDNWKTPFVILQDLIGHGLFLGMLILIAISAVSAEPEELSQPLVLAVLAIAWVSFIVNYLFSLSSLTVYPNRDKKDILIKMSIVPEFIYSNILTFILIGSYAFYLYNGIYSAFSKLAHIVATVHFQLYTVGLLGFQKVGYSSNWGTK